MIPRFDDTIYSITTAMKHERHTIWGRLRMQQSGRIFNEHLANPIPPVEFLFAGESKEVYLAYRTATFAAVSIGAKDEKKFTEWAQSNSVTPVEAANALLGRGYKISISWVVNSNAFCVSLIGTPTSKTNDGVIMTSWSDDLEEAILIAAYKHLEMCGDGAWPTRDDTQRWG